MIEEVSNHFTVALFNVVSIMIVIVINLSSQVQKKILLVSCSLEHCSALWILFNLLTLYGINVRSLRVFVSVVGSILAKCVPYDLNKTSV